MPMLEVTGGELYYEERGDGERSIVFAHGAGGNHMSWWQQVPHFSQRYRCITIDHRGFGQSLDHTGESIRAYPRDLEELLDHLGVASTAIIAQSMGGFTGMTFAGRRPERVWALVMANTFLGVGDGDLLARVREHWANLAQIDPGGPAYEQTIMVGDRFKREHPDKLFLYQQVRALNPLIDLPEGYSIEDGAIPVADLANLDVPVLFLAGEADATIPIELTAAAQHHVAGSSIELVPEAGHSLYWEMPEVFNARVDAFFDGVLAG
ncbi:MAG: alpha/beta fold hydrolase [Chloroflexi bacterium]|nr:alpha/beta fold hydrolase [Chloroflexota bacterium]